MGDFPEKLRQAMHKKLCKSADISKHTGINPSALSRYLSGANKPSSDNIVAISRYLNVSPEWLLNSPEPPDPIQKNHVTLSPHLKTIEVQDKLIKNLEKEVVRLGAKVKEWEEWKTNSKERHAKGKLKLMNLLAKTSKR